ncbi:uncharacterized protein BYT42DRAFT_585661 [Radiomyces spectabilis]|uniref:uncharacterized protein n=1 Tax=Radiomyces spectabilis TaxID=64574 RepID=UPI0022201C81|nr:uncharacterized protein BYT42DRAFT_585661 [Radiomyces spectabilis]KAI8368188.1 hypothetical protein BYT42DRAFT_585661 [Radiomyces spectabilis]
MLFTHSHCQRFWEGVFAKGDDGRRRVVVWDTFFLSKFLPVGVFPFSFFVAQPFTLFHSHFLAFSFFFLFLSCKYLIQR